MCALNREIKAQLEQQLAGMAHEELLEMDEQAKLHTLLANYMYLSKQLQDKEWRLCCLPLSARQFHVVQWLHARAEHKERRGHTLRVFEEQLAVPQASQMRSLATLWADGIRAVNRQLALSRELVRVHDNMVLKAVKRICDELQRNCDC